MAMKILVIMVLDDYAISDDGIGDDIHDGDNIGGFGINDNYVDCDIKHIFYMSFFIISCTSHRSKAYLSKNSLSFECLSGPRSSATPHHG
jgi:hypothetical protein